MDKEVYKIRLDKWRKLIYEANTCGMKKTEWCRINGVSRKQFYYWQKKVRAQALEEIQDGTSMNDTAMQCKYPRGCPGGSPHTQLQRLPAADTRERFGIRASHGSDGAEGCLRRLAGYGA